MGLPLPCSGKAEEITAMKARFLAVLAALPLLASAALAQEQQAPSANMMSSQSCADMMSRMMMMGQGMMGDGMGMMGRRMMGRGMMGPGRGRMGHGLGMRLMMILMDTDGDGALSLEEVQAAHARIFKQVDA